MPNRQIADSLGINSATAAEPVGNDGRGVCVPRLDVSAMRAVLAVHRLNLWCSLFRCACPVCENIRSRLREVDKHSAAAVAPSIGLF